MTERRPRGQSEKRRFNGGGESRLNKDVYKYLENDVIEDEFKGQQGKLQDAIAEFQGARNNTNVNERTIRGHIRKINLITQELGLLEGEMQKRGLYEDEDEEPDTSKEDEYREHKEHKSGMDMVGATNERLQTIRNVDGKRSVRKDYKNFDEMWDEAHKENKTFNQKKEKEAKKEKEKAAKERAKSDQEFEKKEWERIEKEDVERNDAILDAHNKAAAEGRVERSFATKAEMEEQAREDNEAINELRQSAEYKVEQGLKEIYDKIKKTRLIYSERYISHKRSGFLERLNPKKAYEAAKNKKAVEELDVLKHALTSQEVSYIKQKQEFREKLEGFSFDDTRGLSNMSEGTSNRTRAEFDKVLAQLSILEEQHRDEKSEILWQLNDLGVDVFDEGNIDNIKLEEIGVVYEDRKDTRFKEINSRDLSPDEEIFRKQEERDLGQDMGLQRKLKSIENQMRRASKNESTRGISLIDFFKQTPDLEITKRNKQENKQNMPEINKQIQREIERYKRMILESRIRTRRFTRIIEEEKQKGPEEMNLTAVRRAMKGIKSETVSLKRHSEEMRQKVILIDKKSRLSGLLGKVGLK